MAELTHDEIVTLLQRHAGMLSEHFDAVQVLATTIDPVDGSTTLHQYGIGNYYARFGMADAYVQLQRSDMDQRDVAEEDE